MLLRLQEQEDVAQAPLQREQQLERSPEHQAESLGSWHPPPASGELGAAWGESEPGLGAKAGCRAQQGRGAAQALLSTRWDQCP